MEPTNDESKSDIKEVPDSLEDITPQWCQEALRKGGVISSSIKVSSVDVKRLVNEETGAVDGGGMTAAQMVRITLTYEEGHTDDANIPKSMIAKCVLSGKRMMKVPWHFRLLLFAIHGKNYEERLWRSDIRFYREAIPHVKDIYRHPKVYYTGLIDGGNQGFFTDTILQGPHKIRTITLMQDMQGWKSQMIGIHHLNFDQAVAILENAAVLHGNFWGDKNKNVWENFFPSNSELELRRASHSKFASMKRNKIVSSQTNLQKTIKKMLKNWDSNQWFGIPKEDLLPSWVTSKPADDSDADRILILKDPNVLEMLEVLAERFPDFNTEFSKPFLKVPCNTLLHGDFHNGNHMYLEEEDMVKVVAFDFQCVGRGVAISDVLKLMLHSKRHTSLNDDLNLLKRYHDALVLSGVQGYTYEDIKKDFVVGYVELMLAKIMDHADYTYEKYTKLIQGIFGEEKFADIKRIMEGGVYCNAFTALTSMYLHDKENFLKGTAFIDGIS